MANPCLSMSETKGEVVPRTVVICDDPDGGVSNQTRCLLRALFIHGIRRGPMEGEWDLSDARCSPRLADGSQNPPDQQDRAKHCE